MRTPSIVHASRSATKILAVDNIVPSIFPDGYDLTHVDGDSGFGRQPLGSNHTYAAAEHRAHRAYCSQLDFDLAIGIESGIFELPGGRGYMEKCVCALFGGYGFAHGESSGYIIPRPIMKLIRTEQLSLAQAFRKLELVATNTGHGESGITEMLTAARITRREQNEHALSMAFAQIMHPELYDFHWNFYR